MQYTVKKPINNNILRVVDPTGCELIVTGRGLGFGVKPGYKIEAETGRTESLRRKALTFQVLPSSCINRSIVWKIELNSTA